MPNRPHTDLHKLVHAEVESHMRPFVYANMIEHEQTRKVVKENTSILKQISYNRTHTYINSFLIGVLFIGMLIILTGC